MRGLEELFARNRAWAAAGVGARLATGNPRHFPMPELRVEHWVAGA